MDTPLRRPLAAPCRAHRRCFAAPGRPQCLVQCAASIHVREGCKPKEVAACKGPAMGLTFPAPALTARHASAEPSARRAPSSRRCSTPAISFRTLIASELSVRPRNVLWPFAPSPLAHPPQPPSQKHAQAHGKCDSGAGARVGLPGAASGRRRSRPDVVAANEGAIKGGLFSTMWGVLLVLQDTVETTIPVLTPLIKQEDCEALIGVWEPKVRGCHRSGGRQMHSVRCHVPPCAHAPRSLTPPPASPCPAPHAPPQGPSMAGLSMGLAAQLAAQAVADGETVDSAKVYEEAQKQFLEGAADAWVPQYTIFGCDPATGAWLGMQPGGHRGGMLPWAQERARGARGYP